MKTPQMILAGLTIEFIVIAENAQTIVFKFPTVNESILAAIALQGYSMQLDYSGLLHVSLSRTNALETR